MANSSCLALSFWCVWLPLFVFDARTQLDSVYIRGSKIRFMVLPDMLKNAPMFKVRLHGLWWRWPWRCLVLALCGCVACLCVCVAVSAVWLCGVSVWLCLRPS